MSNRTGILKISDQKFKTTLINILRAPMEKLDHTQNRWAMRADRWECEERVRVLEIKQTVTERENACNGLVSRPVTTEERIFEHEAMTTETFKTKKKIKGKKRNKKEIPEYPRPVRHL